MESTINVKELRIGNSVYYGGVATVEGIQSDKIKLYGKWVDVTDPMLMPLPITNNLLTYLGFTEFHRQYMYNTAFGDEEVDIVLSFESEDEESSMCIIYRDSYMSQYYPCPSAIHELENFISINECSDFSIAHMEQVEEELNK